MSKNKIAVVTGSCSQIPKIQQEKLGIKVLPFTIHIDGKSYTDDGVSITSSQLYRLMRSSNFVPTTAPPSNGDYLSTFQLLFEQGYRDVVYFSISRKLSSDYMSALGAAGMLNSNYPDHKVHVVDSTCAAISQGFLAIEAAEKIGQGKPLKEIFRWLEQARSRAGIVVSLETFEYLARGGRIGKASKFLGSMLDIKPLISLVNGVVAPVAIQRGSKRILSAILDRVEKMVRGWKKLRLAVLHADDLQRAEILLVMAKSTFNNNDIYLCELTPVMGVHIGPGLIGLGYYFE